MTYPAAEQRGICKGNETPTSGGELTLVRLWRIKERWVNKEGFC
jgi:hypothetical protein